MTMMTLVMIFFLLVSGVRSDHRLVHPCLTSSSGGERPYQTPSVPLFDVCASASELLERDERVSQVLLGTVWRECVIVALTYGHQRSGEGLPQDTP